MSSADNGAATGLAARLRGLRREAGALSRGAGADPGPPLLSRAEAGSAQSQGSAAIGHATGGLPGHQQATVRAATAMPPATARAAADTPATDRGALPDAWQTLLGRAPVGAANAAIPRKSQVSLRRLLQVRGRRHAAVADTDPRDRELPGETIAPGLYYTELLADWPPPPDAAIDARFARLDETIAPQRLLHFDTETTGLAGGTGTRAFMIGAADWHQGRFRIRQLTISNLAGEHHMLAEFASWLRSDTVLVSYNGKSYDAPLLATRYRLARRDNPLLGKTHLDLLHPVRRHWRSEWENCRLGTAERQLLGVVREDDLPGAEAPAAWLGYLRGGSARNLRRVAEHNQQDLRSLAGILLKLRLLAATPMPPCDQSQPQQPGGRLPHPGQGQR